MTTQLPKLDKHDHPDCHTMVWSESEMRAIKAYATAAVYADRALRVPDAKPYPELAYSSDRNYAAGWNACRNALLASTPQAQPARKPMTVDDIWNDNELMSANADAHLIMSVLQRIVAGVEAFHDIKEQS